MKPFVKWAGGKRQILDRIMKCICISSEEDNRQFRYVEPFLGGGVVFFNLKPKRAIINDLNSELINTYKVIKSDDYKMLINELKNHAIEYKKNEDEYYYSIRAWDREENWKEKTLIERAGRMIFLNRTCYNGLYRVNLKGQFNTPIGRYVNPTICDEINIEEIHEYLKEYDIEIYNSSYEEILKKCGDNDLVYIDPPYDYRDDDGFTKYQMEGFTFEDFKILKRHCDEAIDRGAYIVISNNATDKVLDLFLQDVKYTAYTQDTFKTLRTINCKGGERKTGFEVIIVGVSYKIVPQANDMNKIIKLATAGIEVLYNKDFAKKTLGVNTDRQVAYYLSALSFFDYILSTNEFSEKFLEMNFDKERISKDIYMKLIRNKDFSRNRKASKYEIKDYLKNEYNVSSDVTADRRASTIISWIQWMNEYKKSHLE